MKILLDGDACPVTDIAIRVAKEYGVEIVLVKNYAHVIEDSYATIVTVDIARDSADFYIVNNTEKDDIVITQDYGLSAMALSKGGICINQNGLIISSHNIDELLSRRHINQKLRREQKIYSKFKKRDKKADIKFEKSLRKLIIRAQKV